MIGHPSQQNCRAFQRFTRKEDCLELLGAWREDLAEISDPFVKPIIGCPPILDVNAIIPFLERRGFNPISNRATGAPSLNVTNPTWQMLLRSAFAASKSKATKFMVPPPRQNKLKASGV
jgi:hypothetical protein